MTILVTGAAGFIGADTALALLERGHVVVGIDNLNSYYDPSLKLARLKRLSVHTGFTFEALDFSIGSDLRDLFARHRFDCVVHLGAQAGVSYSVTHPEAYIDSNLTGFAHILEACRQQGVSHLVYASSSSVYGANTRMPFRAEDGADHPLSLYAATKRANELMAHSYSHLFGLPTTGLRFFTVYGPWGRPDMAPLIFIRRILAGKPIELFNNGEQSRDFTYISDIVEGVVQILDRPATSDPSWSGFEPNPSTSAAPWRIYNIGHSQPVPLLEFVKAIELATGKSAVPILKPQRPGDVLRTAADIISLEAAIDFKPMISIQEGIDLTVRWYRSYYGE